MIKNQGIKKGRKKERKKEKKDRHELLQSTSKIKREEGKENLVIFKKFQCKEEVSKELNKHGYQLM